VSVPAKVCVEDGCERPVKSRGTCGAHLERERRRRLYGPPQRVFGERKPCAAGGCDRLTYTPGTDHCRMHYYRLRNNGTLVPKIVRGERGPCGASECTRLVRTPGLAYCDKHQQRYAKHGDPSVVGVGNYRGEAVTYKGAHERVYALHGPAARHPCVDCGALATEWSYDHSDPDPRTCELRGSPYSTDPERYEARCHGCHVRYDNAVSRSGSTPERQDH
jgi:hypothetical protein